MLVYWCVSVLVGDCCSRIFLCDWKLYCLKGKIGARMNTDSHGFFIFLNTPVALSWGCLLCVGVRIGF